ncbi:hypothetical protein QTP88_008894 [Uroleucon formosanum]
MKTSKTHHSWNVHSTNDTLSVFILDSRKTSNTNLAVSQACNACGWMGMEKRKKGLEEERVRERYEKEIAPSERTHCVCLV